MIYLDANCIIYVVEGAPALRQRVLQHIAAGSGGVATSRLSRLECRVKPLKDSNASLLNLFDQFFARPDVTILEIDAAVIDRATEIRARFAFKTPDAIHLASAIVAGAERFLTADQRLSRFTDIHVEVI